jgi:quinol monooxygenase YgiN
VIDLPSSTQSFGEDTYLVIEKWRDEIALAAHRTAAHMLTYAEQSKHLIADRRIHLLQAAD